MCPHSCCLPLFLMLLNDLAACLRPPFNLPQHVSVSLRWLQFPHKCDTFSVLVTFFSIPCCVDLRAVLQPVSLRWQQQQQQSCMCRACYLPSSQSAILLTPLLPLRLTCCSVSPRWLQFANQCHTFLSWCRGDILLSTLLCESLCFAAACECEPPLAAAAVMYVLCMCTYHYTVCHVTDALSVSPPAVLQLVSVSPRWLLLHSSLWQLTACSSRWQCTRS
jgi:hypothetical protein